MTTETTQTTISKPEEAAKETPRQAEKAPPIDLHKIAQTQSGAFLRRMELAGAPETRSPAWPMVKAGVMIGYRMGLELGYKLGFNIKGLDTEPEEVKPDPNQGELFKEGE